MPTDEMIQALLDRWEAAKSQGRFLAVDDLCRDHPHLAGEVRSYIQALISMDKLVGLKAAENSTQNNPETNLQRGLQPGTEIVPGYRLEKPLGSGGFGEVWKAKGPGGIRSALKIVSLGERAGSVELRAFKTIRDIRHPHLIASVGAWKVGTLLVFAMELAEGTLLDRFDKYRKQGLSGIPVSELIRYMRDAAEGLDFLNTTSFEFKDRGSLGIQHRDIKPHNLLVVGGRVKIGDFGLVRLLDHAMTGHTGSLTPSYAAPEFFDGKTSRHSDQYSLAVTYCFLRSGQLPFEGSSAQIMAGHLRQPPNLTRVPPEEREIVARALAKNPENRWPDCRSFIRELRRAISKEVHEAVPAQEASFKTHQPPEGILVTQMKSPEPEATLPEPVGHPTGAAPDSMASPIPRGATKWVALWGVLGILAAIVGGYFILNGHKSPSTTESLGKGDAIIRAKAGASEIRITTTSRVAGAIHSLTWNGKEFIDSSDHGRQLQSAAQFESRKKLVPDFFMVIEAGAEGDGGGEISSSKLFDLRIGEAVLETTTQMAFFWRPRENSTGSLTSLSNHVVKKRIGIGFQKWPNVIDYQVTFTVPDGEKYYSAQYIPFMGHMPSEFNKNWQYQQGKWKPVDTIKPYPIVLSTSNESFALGVWAPDHPTFGKPAYKLIPGGVTRWDCVFEDRQGIKPGSYHFQGFLIVGTLNDVKKTMEELCTSFTPQP